MTFGKTDCSIAPPCVTFLQLKKQQNKQSSCFFGSGTCVISATPAAAAANGL